MNPKKELLWSLRVSPKPDLVNLNRETSQPYPCAWAIAHLDLDNSVHPGFNLDLCQQ